MLFYLLLIGFCASIIGAIAPGASNAVVVKTAMNKGVSKTYPIIYGAGAGEIILVLLASYFGVMITSFFEMHLWAQLILSAVLFIVGGYLVFLHKSKIKDKTSTISNPYTMGFFLSAVNPPVLIYWVLVITALHSMGLSFEHNVLFLIPFIIIVFAGKVLTLMGYAKLGKRLEQKQRDPSKVNKAIGILLMVVALGQLVKSLVL